MKHRQLINLIVSILFLSALCNISAQQKDTASKDEWNNLMSNKSPQNTLEPIKVQEDELLNDVGISFMKDKIVIVRKDL